MVHSREGAMRAAALTNWFNFLFVHVPCVGDGVSFRLVKRNLPQLFLIALFRVLSIINLRLELQYLKAEIELFNFVLFFLLIKLRVPRQYGA